MPNSQLLDCFQSGQRLLDRVNYFPRQLLTADDMVADQDYFRQKLRRHNRFLHGWGVVCGLEVNASPRQDAPWRVRIDGGYALGPFGEEVYVPETVFLDLAQCGPGATTDPCAPDRLRRPDRSAAGEPVFIAIRYEECVARPVRVMSAGCTCDETACEYSRIRDSFQIECLTELPDSHQPGPAGPSLCDFINGQQLTPCLPCPPDSWVVLAEVNLPASRLTNITSAQINNLVRRQLFSTAVLQEMLISCCCEENRELIPARVIAISPEDGDIVGSGSLFSIDILFDKSLHPTTVNAQSIVVTVSPLPNENFPQPGPVPGSISYDEASNMARFTPNEDFRRGRHHVVVRGDTPDEIRDIDNLSLDGNGDGLPGGNFESQFDIITPQ